MAMSRRRQQRKARKGHVDMIVEKMSAKLQTKKQKKRMYTTDRLLPQGSLKRKCVKRLFHPWACDFVGQGRILTLKLCEQVVKRLRKMFQLGPCDPETKEIKTLHRLIKYARKRKIGARKSTQTAMSTDDLMETVPMEFPEETLQDCCIVRTSLGLF